MWIEEEERIGAKNVTVDLATAIHLAVVVAVVQADGEEERCLFAREACETVPNEEVAEKRQRSEAGIEIEVAIQGED